MNQAVVSLRDVCVDYPGRSALLRRAAHIRAVDNVSFDIAPGKTVGLVGESGSGKTTTGRSLLGLTPLSAGTIRILGHDLASIGHDRRALYRMAQMVFQDPYASLNPRMTIGQTLAEVLQVHRLATGEAISRRVAALLAAVGLRPELARRHPHALSGGQRQRAVIARALAMEPRFIVLDEVVSALDVSIQGQIVNLLQDLQRDNDLSYLFISHDLRIVRHIAHEIVVMYGGQIMERGPRDNVFARPLHPYTSALLSAVPIPDPRRERLRPRIEVRAEPPDPSVSMAGCRFQRSCAFAVDLCRAQRPALGSSSRVGAPPDHLAACHRMDDAEVSKALIAAAEGARA